MIIDPPSVFAPKEDWEAFLSDMEKLDHPEAKEWIEVARKEIEAK